MLNRKRVAVSRIGIGLVAVCAAALTSACAAGKHAQTADETPAIDGTTAQVGQIGLHGFALRPPTATTLHPVGSDVRIQLTVVNDGKSADTLTDISTAAASGWGIYNSSAEAAAVQRAANTQSAPAAGSPTAAGVPDSGAGAGATPPPVGATSITIPAGQSVAFDTPTSSKVLMLLNLTKKLYPGTSIRVKVTFAHAGSKTITVPVQLTDNQSRLTQPPPSGVPAPE